MNYNTLILKTKYFSSADLKPIFPKSKHSRLEQHFIELHQQNFCQKGFLLSACAWMVNQRTCLLRSDNSLNTVMVVFANLENLPLGYFGSRSIWKLPFRGVGRCSRDLLRSSVFFWNRAVSILIDQLRWLVLTIYIFIIVNLTTYLSRYIPKWEVWNQHSREVCFPSGNDCT